VGACDRAQAPGVAEIRARAAEQAEFARQIGDALQARDVVSARLLIEEGAARFGHAAMVRAVELEARQEQMEVMDSAQSYPDADRDDWWLDEPYAEED
jgi:hypothetical protein